MTVRVLPLEREPLDFPPTFRVGVIACRPVCVRLLGSYIVVSPDTGGRIVSAGLQRLIVTIIIILTTQLLCCTKQCRTPTVCRRNFRPYRLVLHRYSCSLAGV